MSAGKVREHLKKHSGEVFRPKDIAKELKMDIHLAGRYLSLMAKRNEVIMLGRGKYVYIPDIFRMIGENENAQMYVTFFTNYRDELLLHKKLGDRGNVDYEIELFEEGIQTFSKVMEFAKKCLSYEIEGIPDGVKLKSGAKRVRSMKVKIGDDMNGK